MSNRWHREKIFHVGNFYCALHCDPKFLEATTVTRKICLQFICHVCIFWWKFQSSIFKSKFRNIGALWISEFGWFQGSLWSQPYQTIHFLNITDLSKNNQMLATVILWMFFLHLQLCNDLVTLCPKFLEATTTIIIYFGLIEDDGILSWQFFIVSTTFELLSRVLRGRRVQNTPIVH